MTARELCRDVEARLAVQFGLRIYRHEDGEICICGDNYKLMCDMWDKLAEKQTHIDNMERELADCRRMGAECARQLETANALLKQWGAK